MKTRKANTKAPKVPPKKDGEIPKISINARKRGEMSNKDISTENFIEKNEIGRSLLINNIPIKSLKIDLHYYSDDTFNLIVKVIYDSMIGKVISQCLEFRNKNKIQLLGFPVDTTELILHSMTQIKFDTNLTPLILNPEDKIIELTFVSGKCGFKGKIK